MCTSVIEKYPVKYTKLNFKVYKEIDIILICTERAFLTILSTFLNS